MWDLTIVILDRPRHEKLIADVRAAGARIKLIGDGDLTAAISVAVSGTGVHAVMGTGGAPEGVLSAAALKCLGGEIQAKFRWRSDEERERARTMGVDVDDTERIYTTDDLASGKNVVFAATGVTDGELLRGVRFFGGGARTHSLMTRALPAASSASSTRSTCGTRATRRRSPLVMLRNHMMAPHDSRCHRDR